MARKEKNNKETIEKDAEQVCDCRNNECDCETVNTETVNSAEEAESNELGEGLDDKDNCSEETIEKKLDLTVEALKESNDKYLRLAAEYDNFKRRTRDEKAAIYTESIADVILELLPVTDNFERALSAEFDENSESLSSFVSGIEMIYKQLTEVFEKLGVERIEALNQQFDPNLHNAVMHVNDEQYEDNTVIEELVKGYLVKGKVIRAAMVKVAN